MSLPATAIPLGSGFMPIRFIALPFLLRKQMMVSRLALFFMLGAYVHLMYSVFFELIGVRAFSLIDIGYVLAYIFIAYSIVAVEEDPQSFVAFMRLFLIANAVWAFTQNIMLLLGVHDLRYIMPLSTIKSQSYMIPPSPVIGQFGFYRYSGLFHESAPFVIFLTITHVFFGFLKKDRQMFWLASVLILLSGSKIGWLYLLGWIAVILLRMVKANVVVLIVIAGTGVLFYSQEVLFLLQDEVNGGSYGTLYQRYAAMYRVYEFYNSSLLSSLFGIGFVPSSAVYGGERGGLDFFSVYVTSNGGLGSVLLLFPFFYTFFITLPEMGYTAKSMFFVGLFLALMTSGSLLIVQYVFFVLVLVYSARSSVSDS